ncbi:MAG TPA: stealth family protein [Microbacteriaceae bacterium]|nr:stealth family protein [Microbacteriaceae bacterium]
MTGAAAATVGREHPDARLQHLLQRDDLVRDGGRFALAEPGRTRTDAMAADLRLVRAALETAALGYLLVRGDDDRPIIAVDASARGALETALATAFAAEPFYARVDGPGQRAERLLALGTLPGEDAQLFLLFRRRVRASRAGWRLPEAAVRLELWDFGEEEIVAPRANALTRRRIARDDAVITMVEQHGGRWPSLAGMFDDHADDVHFPIDMVFSWVDGDDPEYHARRAARLAQRRLNPADVSAARYRQIDELRYALRSVHAFAPWVRRIFIATDSPAPAWLNTEHPGVRIVRSSEFFTDPEALPTFNSHAIEAQLHHIPELAEHFLYSNDDMFFGRPVTPAMFFSPGGITRFVEATVRIGLGETGPERTGHDNAMRVNRALLRERFGRLITRHLEHCPAPLRRSVMAELEAAFPDEFARTAGSPFRSPSDISVTNSLYHYYALFTGRAVTQTDLRVRYIETTLADTAAQLRRVERRREYDMFCLNDGTEPEITEEARIPLVTEFLDRYFPVAAPWEHA